MQEAASVTLDSTLAAVTDMVGRWEVFGRELEGVLSVVDNRPETPGLTDSVSAMMGRFTADLDAAAAVHSARVCNDLGPAMAIAYSKLIDEGGDRLINSVKTIERRRNMTAAGSFRAAYDSIIRLVRNDLKILATVGFAGR